MVFKNLLTKVYGTILIVGYQVQKVKETWLWLPVKLIFHCVWGVGVVGRIMAPPRSMF